MSNKLELVFKGQIIGWTWQDIKLGDELFLRVVGPIAVEKIENGQVFIHETMDAADAPALLFLPNATPDGELIHAGYYCDVYRLSSGNLFMTATAEAHEEGFDYFKGLECVHGWCEIWAMLEDLIVDSDWGAIDPSEVGDLTKAPILGEGVYRDDDWELEEGSPENRWAFMDYAIADPLELMFSVGAEWTFAT